MVESAVIVSYLSLFCAFLVGMIRHNRPIIVACLVCGLVAHIPALLSWEPPASVVGIVLMPVYALVLGLLGRFIGRFIGQRFSLLPRLRTACKLAIGTGVLVIAAGLTVYDLNRGARYESVQRGFQDVFVGLVCYLEDNKGCLPPSEAAFLGSSFVKHLEDGSIRIVSHSQTWPSLKSHSVPIRNLAMYELAYGVDLSTLVVKFGYVIKAPAGGKFFLIRNPLSEDDSLSYSRELLELAQKLRTEER